MSLLSKPMLVTLPFLLLLLDFWPLERMKAPDGSPSREPALWRRLVFEKWPFFLLSAASCVVTLWAQKTGGAMADNVLPPAARVGNAFASYLAYLTTTFAPFSLSVLYPHPGKASLTAVVAAAVLLAISVFAVLGARRRPYAAMGWLWFLGALVPVIGLVQVGWQARADRYTYLPSVGLAVILVWGFRDLTLHLGAGTRVRVAVSVAAIALLSFLTWREIGYWKDSETLYARGLASTERNHVLHINLGIERIHHGALSEGLEHFRQAVAIQPGYWYGQLTLGAALAAAQKPAEDIPYLETAVRLHPSSVEGRTALGGALAAQGRLPEAASQLTQAIALEPGSVRAHYALARTLELQGKPREALEEDRATVRLDRYHVDAQARVSQGLLAAGRPAEALAQADEALRFLPDSELLHFARARARGGGEESGGEGRAAHGASSFARPRARGDALGRHARDFVGRVTVGRGGSSRACHQARGAERRPRPEHARSSSCRGSAGGSLRRGGQDGGTGDPPGGRFRAETGFPGHRGPPGLLQGPPPVPLRRTVGFACASFSPLPSRPFPGGTSFSARLPW